MNKSKFSLIMLAGFLSFAAAGRAQNTVVYVPAPPATRLENLETNTGRLIIKASGPIGSTAVSGATVSVTCKEDTDAANGSKLYGIAIGLVSAQTGKAGVRAIVDDDELVPLINAIDYLAKIDWSVTSLPSFDATYQTRSGFRIAVFGVRSTGAVEYSVRTGGMTKGIVLGSAQWAEFRGLIDQARRELDGLHAK